MFAIGKTGPMRCEKFLTGHLNLSYHIQTFGEYKYLCHKLTFSKLSNDEAPDRELLTIGIRDIAIMITVWFL